MYNVSADPMELQNLYHDPAYLAQRQQLEKLLAEQCAQKRLTPCSGDVLGQPDCDQQACNVPAAAADTPGIRQKTP